MATLLGTGLNLAEKMVLANMTGHEGWKVLKKMMAEKCEAATAKVIKIDPASGDYRRTLERLQLEARSMNDFCSSVIKSAEQQAMEAIYDYNATTAEGILEEKEKSELAL